jgi:hypothetical protein
MTKEQQTKYMETEPLRQIIVKLEDQKFKLDCGHHITFGHFLGNDLTIRNQLSSAPNADINLIIKKELTWISPIT